MIEDQSPPGNFVNLLHPKKEGEPGRIIICGMRGPACNLALYELFHLDSRHLWVTYINHDVTNDCKIIDGMIHFPVVNKETNEALKVKIESEDSSDRVIPAILELTDVGKCNKWARVDDRLQECPLLQYERPKYRIIADPKMGGEIRESKTGKLIAKFDVNVDALTMLEM